MNVRPLQQQRAKSELWCWLRISFVAHHPETTLNRRMAVIQQVLVCSSSAHSSFKSRVELDFENCWRVKTEKNSSLRCCQSTICPVLYQWLFAREGATAPWRRGRNPSARRAVFWPTAASTRRRRWSWQSAGDASGPAGLLKGGWKQEAWNMMVHKVVLSLKGTRIWKTHYFYR